ncbi:hypothetical protein QOL99_06920 [Deinococcus sp. MIMF12]|uniref:Uncharacterized protein n=1 Tax=Deinococcus rhizophilus TaxID=3049544 RepID=A0ABT7JJP4_9DEIO|nr:hypothetical protein [Deinococcus rhizophilus]MDL2343879.1 hypothetical protein [Deinococcus rhizophilus]
MPFIEVWSATEVSVNVHDWVGRLHFTSTDGVIDETVHVFPSKLAPEPDAAFAALRRMVDRLPDLTAQLGYPTHLVPVTEGLQSQPLQLADVEEAALGAWRLTRAWHRAPRWTQGAERRVVRGGGVPDRVDWPLTLDHWSRGGFPDHVARDLPHLTRPEGLRSLRELWAAVAASAGGLQGGEDLATRARAALGGLPEPDRTGPAKQGPTSRAARALLNRLGRLRRQATDLPLGHVRMPDLYEVWAQVSVLQVLGSTEQRNSGLL